MKSIILHLLPLFLLSACASLNMESEQARLKRLVSPGTIIELHEPLTVPMDYSRTFIQDGKSVISRELEVRSPYCQFYRFETQQELQTVRVIQPDRFSVIGTSTRMHLASVDPNMLSMGRSMSVVRPRYENFLSESTLQTIIKIKSEKQPAVVELTCMIFSFPHQKNYVTFDEIIETLGDLVTIHAIQPVSTRLSENRKALLASNYSH